MLQETALDPRQRFLGTTKDYTGRTEYFESRGIGFDAIANRKAHTRPAKADRRLLETLHGLDLRGYDAAILEHTLFPRSLRYLQERGVPRLLTRAVNAEFYQRLHYAAGTLRNLGHAGEAFRELRNAFRYLALDRACVRRSTVISINDWDTRNYWNHLARGARAVTVPYFLPLRYEEKIPAPVGKRDACVCLMSTTVGTAPFLISAARAFTTLVEGLGRRHAGWEFLMTGEPLPGEAGPGDRIRPTGFLDSPFDALVEARAVALLSSYGFGFKTKILDAICCGCWVLLPRALHARLPDEVKRCCLVVDPRSPDSFADALDRSREPPPTAGVNACLREAAFASLDRVLLD